MRMLARNDRNWPLSRYFWEDFHGWNNLARDGAYSPNIEINKKKDSYEILAQLPGVQSKDVDVKIDGNTLKISGKVEKKESKIKDTVHSEIEHFSQFERFVRLDEVAIDADKVKAELKDGLLKIQLPFHAESEKKRQIPIKTT